ncbi:hypothetical protein ACFFK0_30075 [Paenibacillus chartarius]|uniref:Uncharacterized protein n=1 Tax=Paenibacillus chartarius TaxID=747481 RepID=A0ABV6DVH3_9BACL
MNENFIRIKSLEGELKMSHKKHEFGLTVSTMEFVLQKPHVNYHVRLADITGIVPFEVKGTQTMTFTSRNAASNEIMTVAIGPQHYRFFVKEAIVHNRSGIFTLGRAQFIMPVLPDLLAVISRYAGMHGLQTE